MKSLASSVLNIEAGILTDIRLAYPVMGRLLSLDESRLTQLTESRGEGLWTLDLPNLHALLIEGLEEGRLSLKGPLSRAVSKRTKVPRLFSGLWLRVFSRDGCLLEAPDVNAIAFLCQLTKFGKKLFRACSPRRLHAAVGEYHNVERQLRPPTLRWESDELDPDRLSPGLHLRDGLDADLPLFPSEDRGNEELGSLLDKCQRTFDLVVSELGFFEPITQSGKWEAENLGTGFRHGPGAVADRSGLVNKYDFPRWSAKLEEWFPYRDCGTIASDTETQPLNHEVPSKLIAVPKTAKTPRLIAAEPTEHQFCQQWIKNTMVERLQALFGQTFVCFERQDLSQQMALQGSKDGRLATVDLSSASDRLSCWLVERAFRSNQSLLHVLHATRTRYLKDGISGKPEYVKLKKFASQGTAVTFPVQSLVFLCIALGCSIQGDVKWSKIRTLRNRVRVFGDDIIVPTHAYAKLVRVLTCLGLSVNENKSFSKGLFREACGMDAWGGFDVTPCAPQRVLNDGPLSRRAILDISNNLFAKGYWNASRALESALGSHLLRRLPTVGRDSGITGRLSFLGASVDHLPRRWNALLHRTEFRVLGFRTRETRAVFGERFSLLQFFTEAPAGNENWSAGCAKRTKVSDGLQWDPLYGSGNGSRSLPQFVQLPSGIIESVNFQ